MKQRRLNLYNLDARYVGALADIDGNVMSVDASEGKQTRPFVGVVVICDEKEYCIPLSSPKPKHANMKSGRDFSKIIDRNGRLIGVLNFNNMIPVDDTVLREIDMVVRAGDDQRTRFYKALLNDELDWCNEHRDLIERKAAKLYRIVTQSPDSARALVSRCCDFKKLEDALAQGCRR